MSAESPVNWADKAAERVEAARRALEDHNKTAPQRRIVAVTWVCEPDNATVQTVGFIERENDYAIVLTSHSVLDDPGMNHEHYRMPIDKHDILEIAECAVGFGNKLSR